MRKYTYAELAQLALALNNLVSEVELMQGGISRLYPDNGREPWAYVDMAEAADAIATYAAELRGALGALPKEA